MNDNANILLFHESPTVEFATNFFIDVPVILQYADTPLIEIVTEVPAGFTTQFSIYHHDGTYLAKVKGSRVLSTPAGTKAGLTLRHPANLTVCEMGGRTIFEIRRKEAAALKTEAELYTPDGSFVRSRDSEFSGRILRPRDAPLQIGGLIISGNTVRSRAVGILLGADGSIAIGVQRSEKQPANGSR